MGATVPPDKDAIKSKPPKSDPEKVLPANVIKLLAGKKG
jgi:hypothetical protein